MVPRDAELRHWWGRRVLYYIAVFILFLIIAFYVGPNEIMFGKVMYPYHSLADYVPEVQKECVPIVRAMKEFERDHGQLPMLVSDLVPQYLSSVDFNAPTMGNMFYYVKGDHLICYDFTPATEGWTVSQGPLVGAIPAPLVGIGPSTRPTTLPATGG
jgi:hypothetical protein